MKFSNGNIFLLLISLLVASASADQNITIIVRATMINEVPLSNRTIKAIDTAMASLAPKLNHAVEAVSGEVFGNATIPDVRQLRVNDNRKLQRCVSCNQSGPTCYIWPTSYPKCPGRRALTMHEKLSEDAILDLTDDDRRRHLQIATLCLEATSGVNSIIHEAAKEGVVPLLPLGSKFVETCFYFTD